MSSTQWSPFKLFLGSLNFSLLRMANLIQLIVRAWSRFFGAHLGPLICYIQTDSVRYAVPKPFIGKRYAIRRYFQPNSQADYSSWFAGQPAKPPTRRTDKLCMCMAIELDGNLFNPSLPFHWVQKRSLGSIKVTHGQRGLLFFLLPWLSPPFLRRPFHFPSLHLFFPSFSTDPSVFSSIRLPLLAQASRQRRSCKDLNCLCGKTYPGRPLAPKGPQLRPRH